MENPQLIALTPAQTGAWVVAGIILSLVLPVAVKTLRSAKDSLETVKPPLRHRIADAWTRYGGNKYLKILLATVVIAVAIIGLLGLQFYTVRDAILAGFAWESFIAKVADQQRNAGAAPPGRV